MVSGIVKVLHVSTAIIEYIISQSFHVRHVSARWVSQNLGAHDRHRRVASSQELLGSHT